MEDDAQNFAVWAEAKGYSRPLILHDLTFARLLDDIVVPYQKEERFFVDGAPLSPKDVKRLKILRHGPSLRNGLSFLHREVEMGKVMGDHYQLRFEILFRESGEDVTSQVIKAFDEKIRPKLKDYLPNRDQLINAAWTFFVEGIKKLSM